MANRYATVDEYIGALPADVQVVLQEVRRSALAAVPGARETIRYQIPTIAINGRSLVHYAAWKHHVSLYPVPGGDAALRQELVPYASGKGTLKFPLGEPVPYDLMERVVAQLLSERAH